MMAIENRVRQVMEDRGMTMYRLAKETGLTYQTVHNLVNPNKQLTRIDMDTLERLCRVLGAQVGELFVFNNEEDGAAATR